MWPTEGFIELSSHWIGDRIWTVNSGYIKFCTGQWSIVTPMHLWMWPLLWGPPWLSQLSPSPSHANHPEKQTEEVWFFFVMWCCLGFCFFFCFFWLGVCEADKLRNQAKSQMVFPTVADQAVKWRTVICGYGLNNYTGHMLHLRGDGLGRAQWHLRHFPPFINDLENLRNGNYEELHLWAYIYPSSGKTHGQL